MTYTYLFYAKRTPIGNFNGCFSQVRVDDLLAHLFTDFKSTQRLDLNKIDDVIIGCANQAGEDNRNLARMSLLLAGFPETVPGTTVNRLCGSSLDALTFAFAKIQAGLADCILAGGAESMTRAPYVLSKANSTFDRNQKMYDTTLGWRFPNPKMEEIFPLLSMGETAEEVQKKTGISRELQDKFALRSHQNAIKAQDNGYFKNEIAPFVIKSKKETTLIEKDEGPRSSSNLEALAKLKPIFSQNGTVTAGNSSSINDGSSLVGVCSEKFLKENNLTPLARIIGGTVAGIHPNIMGLGPVEAINKLNKKFNLSNDKYDLIELNEAFAVQALGVLKELHIDSERVNLWGGAIALGHPLGSSGTRIVTTLLSQMKQDPKQKIGLASMCIGVGQGIAVAIENCH
jgi:acetyl-CoA acyltransferase